MKYRAEIDGLRALAVVPVILFHAGFELFSGGFVGVDVFFVISGYLITTILIEDIENKRFSIVNFYERRARRILPALFFVMLVCIPFAWMWMLPSQMKDFSQSLVAVSLFASNILFWRESGYFDAAAEEKPLLHTWSLAVEEQYYVLFPIFLILAWRFGKNRVFWMIVVMAAISLLLSEWGWRNKATANFYLAPTRAWELFAGSIAAFIVQKQGVKKNNLLALGGLIAILFSTFFYDETTPFPSVYALVPVLGVVLLVLYADKETVAARLLSTKGFVGIGLISYSAYLWHQPLLAFSRLKVRNADDLGSLGLPLAEPSTAITIFVLVATFSLAFLSWKFVEKPFRRNGHPKLINIKWYQSSLAGLFGFMVIGVTGHIYIYIESHDIKNDIQLSKSWGEDVRQFVCLLQEPHEMKHADECLNIPADVVLWGDSHAASLSPGLGGLLSVEEVRFSQLTQSGCGPLAEINKLVYRHNCNEVNALVLDKILEHKFSNIVLHAAWLHEHYPMSVREIETKLEIIIDELKSSLPTANIVLVGAVPRWKKNPQFHRVAVEYENLLLSQSAFLLEEVNYILKELASRKDIGFVDPTDVFCFDQENDKGCVLALKTKDNRDWIGVTTDYGHLSTEASYLLARRVISQLRLPQ